jgi:hypothetical protein
VTNEPGVPDHAAPEYDVVSDDTIEPKTKSATVAAGSSAAVITPAVVLAVDQLFYGGGDIDVPLPYVGLIGLIVTGVSTFVASYYARHVQRA